MTSTFKFWIFFQIFDLLTIFHYNYENYGRTKKKYDIRLILCLLMFLFPLSSSFLFGSNNGNDSKVIIKSSEPVTLDTPIWFHAELFPYKTGTYIFKWEDDLWPKNTFTDEQGPISTWSLIYHSDKYENYIGKHSVRVRVYTSKFNEWVDNYETHSSLTFHLTNNINGNVTIAQPNATVFTEGYISTKNVTNVTAIIHDPHSWIRNHTQRIFFYWQIRERETRNLTILGPCFTPSLIINFTQPGDYFIQTNIILTLSDKPVTPTTTTTTTITTTTTTTPPPNSTTTAVVPHNNTTAQPPPNSTTTTVAPHNKTTTTPPSPPPPPDPLGYVCDGWWNGYSPSDTLSESSEKSRIKYGILFTDVSARDPMYNFSISGSTWLHHGALLNLKVKCAGTGPFVYCYNITYGTYNKTDPKICLGDIHESECGFPIQHYLPQAGTYTLVVRVSNHVSMELVRIGINVYNVDRKPQLLHIIIPVSCSLVAIIIIIFGIAHFIQSKHRFSVEVADFDFGASEEDESKSFLTQLREALAASFSADLDSRPHRGRLPRSRIERPTILEDED